MTTYSVRAVKAFKGRQGYGFSATLLADGRKVADVLDEANGGAVRFHWLATDRAQAQADEAALAAHCATLTPDADGLGADPDSFVVVLVDTAENETRFRRMLSSRVVLLLDGGVRSVSAKPTPDVLKQAAAKWPTAQVLNTMDRDAAVAVMMQHAEPRA